MTISQVPPLHYNVPIVYPPGHPQVGCPTPEFATLMQILLEEKQATDNLAEAAVPGSRLINTTSPITGGGDLSADRTIAHATSGVTAGSYGDATHVGQFTVDAKGHISAAANVAITGGGGGTATKYSVATAGDTFINVPLDSDNGYLYEVAVVGAPSANATLSWRISNDNCATVKSGASDYKFAPTSAGSALSLSAGQTIGSGRPTHARFSMSGMNVVAGADFVVNGTLWTVNSSAINEPLVIGGAKNALTADNWNGFQVLVSAGTMDGFAVYLRKIY